MLQGLRRAYFNMISTHGSLSHAFTTLCNCVIHGDDTCIPFEAFSNILSQRFPQGAFHCTVHRLVWGSASAQGVSRELFVAVMSRAPLLLSYPCCHAMCCILSLCKSNGINCSEVFFHFSSSDDGLIRRSEYVHMSRIFVFRTLELSILTDCVC